MTRRMATPPNGWGGWLRLAGTLLALALLALLLVEQGWDEIIAALRQMALWRVVVALMLMLLSRLAVTGRWHVLLRSGGAAIDFRQSLRITFAGLFATNFLPTTIGGDLVRLAGALQLRLDPALSAASLIADRLVGMAGMALVLPLSLPALQAVIHPASGLWRSAWTGESPALAGAAPWLARPLAKLRAVLLRLLDSLQRWVHQPRALLLALACTGVHMLCTYAILKLLLNGVGEDMPLGTLAGLYSLVYFVTLIPISINGYGLQELSMTMIFSNLGQASLGAGVTVALLFRTLMVLASLPGALALPDLLAARRLAAQAPTAGVDDDEANDAHSEG